MSKIMRYKEPDDLKKVIDAYFKTTPQEDLTGTGLAMKVGGKQLLSDYQKREGYSDIIKEAKLRIENAYEIDLRKKSSPTGAIFALKNYGWTDRQEINNTGLPTSVINITNFKDLTDEQLQAIAGGKDIKPTESK